MKKEQVYGPASYGVQLSVKEMGIVLYLLSKDEREDPDSSDAPVVKGLIDRMLKSVRGHQ